MGSLRKELAAALIVMSRDARYTVDIRFQAERPYEHSLNLLARQASDEGYDYWLTLDDDQCPTRNPLDLVELDCDVVSCPAPIWMPDKSPDCPVVWNAFRDLGLSQFEVHRPMIGLQEVDIVGSGALLIAKRVFDVLERPFLIDWDAAGRKLAGPDIAFCRRARDAGFTVWCHYDYPCHHYVTTDISEVGTWIAEHILNATSKEVLHA
jgi:hypothetical protein